MRQMQVASGIQQVAVKGLSGKVATLFQTDVCLTGADGLPCVGVWLQEVPMCL
jgi:hypothetical protein